MSTDGGRPRGSPSLPDKVIAIHRALAAAKISHAIGGAMALAYYAEPRATIDVDVNVFVLTDRWPEVRDVLAPLGIDVEIEEEALERDGQVRLWWERNPVDLFFSYDPFHEEMEGATRRVPFTGTKIPILAPEHLVICKAMFDRPKDWLDIEAILIVTEPLGIATIEYWLERMVGIDDERLKKLRGLIEQFDLRDPAG
jgi:hypothetical protein